MPKVIANTKDMSRADWLAIRSKYIGGSDAAVVLGLSKWKTPFELYLEKTGQVEPQEIDNDAIYFGNALEDFVAKEFERRSGKKVRRKNQMLQHDNYDFMMANLDRVIVGENALLECKTTSAYNAKDWEGDEVPTNYLVQVNHYLAVTGYEKAYIAVLIGGQKFVWKEIERDEELITLIIEALQRYWEFHIKGNNPPALDGTSAAEKYLKERFAKGNPELIVDLTAEQNESIKEYLSLEQTIKQLQEQAKAIKHDIQNTMQEAETAISKDFTTTWKTVKSNRVDSKALKTKFPDVYEQVKKESISRRFDIKEIELGGYK
jgi:putative phage-type endonuclease